MNTFIYLLSAFAIIVICKILINASKLREAKKYRDLHFKYITAKDTTFGDYIPQIKKLIKDADLGNTTIPVAQPLGYGTFCLLYTSPSPRD